MHYKEDAQSFGTF